MTTGGTSKEADAVRSLHHAALEAWNGYDAPAFASLFAEDGSVVGFDGSMVDGRDAIQAHLEGIFADHQPAAYVGKVREVRELAPSAAVLLRAVVGMVPPGADDLNPDVNAVQTLVATCGQDGTWRIALCRARPPRSTGGPTRPTR